MRLIATLGYELALNHRNRDKSYEYYIRKLDGSCCVSDCVSLNRALGNAKHFRRDVLTHRG